MFSEPGRGGLPLFAVALAVCFALPLSDLIRFSMKSDFFSYIPLVPFISGYFIWLERSKLPDPAAPSWGWAALFAALGLALLGVYGWVLWDGDVLDISTYLAALTASYLCFLVAGAFYFLGAQVLRVIAFPVAFLVFFYPAACLLA